jgi:hypothetical protein
VGELDFDTMNAPDYNGLSRDDAYRC